MKKHKYFFSFDCFGLQFNTLSGLMDGDCTPMILIPQGLFNFFYKEIRTN